MTGSQLSIPNFLAVGTGVRKRSRVVNKFKFMMPCQPMGTVATFPAFPRNGGKTFSGIYEKASSGWSGIMEPSIGVLAVVLLPGSNTAQSGILHQRPCPAVVLPTHILFWTSQRHHAIGRYKWMPLQVVYLLSWQHSRCPQDLEDPSQLCPFHGTVARMSQGMFLLPLQVLICQEALHYPPPTGQ